MCFGGDKEALQTSPELLKLSYTTVLESQVQKSLIVFLSAPSVPSVSVRRVGIELLGQLKRRLIPTA